MRNRHTTIWNIVWLGAIFGLLAGCSTPRSSSTSLFHCIMEACVVTQTYNHPLIQTDISTGTEYATIYFIRPNTEHVQGFPDNPLNVQINGEKLMELGKGEYTLVYLKPGQVSITLENLTQVRGRWELETKTQTRYLEFETEQTYYLVTQPFDGEFRGVHFTPELASRTEAQNISQHLRAVGEAENRPL